MSDEDVAELQEELAAAQEARAAHLEAQLSELRQELSRAVEQGEARQQELAGLTERANALEAQLGSAAERYRELALRQSPELPEELVAGETVEEIDQAIERARETVSKVRGHLESQAQAARVPVGAPVRSGPDLSGMSAEEKIKVGLRQGGR